MYIHVRLFIKKTAKISVGSVHVVRFSHSLYQTSFFGFPSGTRSHRQFNRQVAETKSHVRFSIQPLRSSSGTTLTPRVSATAIARVLLLEARQVCGLWMHCRATVADTHTSH